MNSGAAPDEINQIFEMFTLTNDSLNGQIKYETNIISIDYHGDEEFEYEDGYINLLDKTLIYDRGFKIANNCTFIIKGKNMYRSETTFFSLFDEKKKNGFSLERKSIKEYHSSILCL